MNLPNLFFSILCAGALAQQGALADDPTKPIQKLGQVPGVVRFMLGDLRISCLSDGTCQLPMKGLKGASKEEITDLLHRSFQSDPIEASINCFLIESGKKLVLIDTGSGDVFGPGVGEKLRESLAVAGFKPEQVTDIMITHVHSDHSGGLVKDGKMLFPNATIHAGKADVDFFLNKENSAKTGYDIHYFNEAEKTFKPYVDAGRVVTFATDKEILPGITAVLHPGHTPGSAFYVVKSKDKSMEFMGDVVHVTAVQLPRPDITIEFDVDSKEAAKVREEDFARFARDKTLFAAPHLPFPCVDHIRAEQTGYTWVPMDYTNRD